jgi:MFS transporter, SP family, sugar:H+ symporter
MSQSSSASFRGGANKLVYVFGALGGLLFGYDTGKIAGAIIFVQQDLDLTPFMEGLVVSSLLVGAAVGAGSSGALSDRMGRRMVILLAAIIFAGTAIGEALSPNAAFLVAMRLVGGLAVGAASLTVPLYLSEMAPTRIRGALSSLNQLMIVTGILAAYIVNYTLADAEAWRWMFAAAFFPASLLLVGMIFMPETPRWLVKHDRTDDAREVLRRVRGESDVEDELEEIRRIDEMEEAEGGDLRELLRTWVRPALVVAIGLAVFQQVIGINTIIYYAPTTLTNVGFGDAAAILANVGIGVVNVAMTVLAIYLIDRVGRKPLLLAGLVGMVMSLTVLGIVTLLLPEPGGEVGPIGIITLVCLAIYIASFAATWGPVVWVMLPEVLPLKIRGTAMGVAVILHWLANFTVSLTFPVLLDAIGVGLVFLGYAVIGVAAFLFVRSRVTETKERSLEQIETALRERAGSTQ